MTMPVVPIFLLPPPTTPTPVDVCEANPLFRQGNRAGAGPADLARSKEWS
jgi:hypothetical protein